ncbi:hypothetical protein RJT34_00718 [Clitoria ternatea]|uniref:RING-type E3 ubiquitin transferase n=1 Tax=Clitoria ternatea TaxID=43366 RepID=A0AAN9PY72_CLITE
MYCPQWCYILYSPPPPAIIFDNTDEPNSSPSFEFSPLIVAIIGILASTFILVTYYTIISRFCRCRARPDPEIATAESAQAASDSGGLDEALIKSIAVCKYNRGGGLVEGVECCVCLSEFEENQSLRLLPKCNHAFHLPCIDTWLMSNSTCPLCRSSITIPSMEPPPSVRIENNNANNNALDQRS